VRSVFCESIREKRKKEKKHDHAAVTFTQEKKGRSEAGSYRKEKKTGKSTIKGERARNFSYESRWQR